MFEAAENMVKLLEKENGSVENGISDRRIATVW